MPTADAIHPFRINVPDEDLADLSRRIAAVRWPSKELVADRSQGVQVSTIQELARYWTSDYDWRTFEAALNTLPQFKTEIDGVDVHFIHVESPHANALPLIITHGWPGSVVELLGVVGPLTDPTAYGGSAEDAFHLVLPSIPGSCAVGASEGRRRLSFATCLCGRGEDRQMDLLTRGAVRPVRARAPAAARPVTSN